jgi:hypothetical protein
MWSCLFIEVVFDNNGLAEPVCENFMELNDHARGEPMHNLFMDKFPIDTNQGTPSQGDSCVFPFFGNIGVPLMATLYIPGLNVGLPVWLGTIPNVPNALDASQLRTLCHGHHVDVSSSTMSSPPPSTFSGESIATSNRKSKRNRKRKNRKNKSPTSVSHVGDRSSTSSSHVEYQHPTPAIHVGGKIPVTSSHTGDRFVASASHVEDVQPTIASHAGVITLICTRHTYLASNHLIFLLCQNNTKQLFLKTPFIKAYVPCSITARVYTLAAPIQLACTYKSTEK